MRRIAGRPPRDATDKRRPELFGKQDKSLPTLLLELKQLTIDYTKQQTLDPLKNLGRYVGLGVAGSLFLGIGLVMWALAILRALQNETGSTFTDHLSWVPYLITLVVCAALAGASAYAIGAEKRRSKKRKAKRAAQEGAQQ